MSTVNPEGRARMAAEKAWVRAHARFAVGDEVRAWPTGWHAARGAEGEVVDVRLDHTHPSGHDAACWSADRIEYAVAFGYDRATGKAALRCNFKATELTRV